MRTQRGEARVLLGTRLSIFAPLPDLGLIIVDEEHDASYRQQDGLRYSARDLAVWRARERNIPVVLGSATPSLESWNHAETGHYQRFTLAKRAKAVERSEEHLSELQSLMRISYDVFCLKNNNNSHQYDYTHISSYVLTHIPANKPLHVSI